MKIKVTELAGTALDWAVAKCEGHRVAYQSGHLYLVDERQRRIAPHGLAQWTPCNAWAQGGPIVERQWICVDRLLNGLWLAAKRTDAGDSMLFAQTATAPLVAAMRCHVASVLGEVVDVPDELVPAKETAQDTERSAQA